MPWPKGKPRGAMGINARLAISDGLRRMWERDRPQRIKVNRRIAADPERQRRKSESMKLAWIERKQGL